MDFADLEEKIRTFFDWLTAFFNEILDVIKGVMDWADDNNPSGE